MSSFVAKKDSIVIVDKSLFMRNILKNIMANFNCNIHEATDAVGALNISLRYDPNVIFISIESDKCWPSLVQSLKKKQPCKVVAYSTGVTRDMIASAFFAGVDEILVNPQNQRERIEKCLANNPGLYNLPTNANVLGS
ncbi:MAG: hypothetical protein ACOY46_15270 [Bacillota bacterium]